MLCNGNKCIARTNPHIINNNMPYKSYTLFELYKYVEFRDGEVYRSKYLKDVWISDSIDVPWSLDAMKNFALAAGGDTLALKLPIERKVE